MYVIIELDEENNVNFAKTTGRKIAAFFAFGEVYINKVVFNVFRNPITKFLEERNLTRRELAEACGVTLGTVSAWIRGDFGPSEKNLQNVSEFGLIPAVAVEEWAEWRKALGDSQLKYLAANGNGQERLPRI